jgi:predicted DsbA family dithiol-disulfide isomerase
LRHLQTDLGDHVRVAHRNFVLVAEERADRRFSDYHLAHRHAAAVQDADAPTFDLPAVGDPYPCSSLPALEAATWARETHPGLFPAFDLALFEAFFGRTEDISDPEVLARLAASVGLDPLPLREALTSGMHRRTVLQEHLEASDQGIHGIPAIVVPGRPPIVGAVPYADLKRAAETAINSQPSAVSGRAGEADG